MDKVAIYARVSTADGKQSYERQIQDLTRIALQHGYTNEQIHVFAEMVSGYQKERPEMIRLLNIVENEPQTYKIIYCTEISRVGRNPKNTREIIDKLTELNVPLWIDSIKQATIESSGKRNIIVSIILQVLMEFADLESEQMKTRMASGKMKRAKEGKTSNSVQPYGYTSDSDGYVIIDEEERIIIEQIFESYQSGIGTRIIAQTLNTMQVPTTHAKRNPTKVYNYNKSIPTIEGNEIKWTDVVVRQILINPIYKGDRKFKDEIIKVEPIVSAEAFDYCNELLKTKNTRNILTKHEYLLKDLIRCGCCGRIYMGRYVLGGDAVYRCTSSLKTRCANRSINISLIETIIYSLILNSDALLKTLENPNEMLNQIKKELKQNEQLLKNEEKELTAKQKQLENLLTTMTLSANPNFSLYTKLENDILTQIDLIKNKISLLKRDIFSKITTVQNFNIEATSRDMIVKAQHNRHELKNIFKQFVQGIVINDLRNGYVLANLTIKINGVAYTNQRLKLFVYANGVRKYGGRNEKTYKYLSALHLINDPTYKNNILTTEIQDIKEEFERLVEQSKDTTGLIPIHKFYNIPKENRLYINECDL
ncbi:recombinase family protein [Flavobacterium aquicola]|uniref:DNA invertase Pin-like site-specific DNA recombinase n=1 Tax=Flavobacterium aquicola TaxID=1682742 RepID=A0A3E0ESZ0_9FLAO|nr:recombinase family protein [Flavobacterium aquicola]REH00904.1 DNA invertase Pin-like site-specific DNA recombinase [Flavobacterium aquicola]